MKPVKGERPPFIRSSVSQSCRSFNWSFKSADLISLSLVASSFTRRSTSFPPCGTAFKPLDTADILRLSNLLVGKRMPPARRTGFTAPEVEDRAEIFVGKTDVGAWKAPAATAKDAMMIARIAEAEWVKASRVCLFFFLGKKRPPFSFFERFYISFNIKLKMYNRF
jgi:hypothetical protein